MAVPDVALAGVGGWGEWHLGEIDRLRASGEVRLVAACDPDPPAAIGDTLLYPDLDSLLRDHSPDIVVIAAPPHTHAPLAIATLRAGADVLLEKPPVTGIAEFHAVEDVRAATGRAVQVGFQSLGSRAIPALRELIASGELGALRGIGAACSWVRPHAYFQRAPWAGRRELDGVPVVDGSLTNPFAHAVIAALALTGEPVRIELELLRANDIAADDTACARITTASGPPVVVAATLCATQDRDPRIIVHGEHARAELYYTRDRLDIVRDGVLERHEYGRVGLLENLLAHRAHGDPLLAPLASCAGFTEVLQAVRDAPQPLRINDSDWHDVDGHRVLHGVDEAVERAANELKLFTELGVGWAAREERECVQ
ncbi:putative dehydrogenase [Herbihabitans rhizosphaerae]|uniref:Putative dehydrogenase n=1 Tax=Herbihabitans rhizosphaerae TaxID=1872711 RepID=A0A4Q7KE48_9PSEU|nr:Gfo/Idh/MocA family oxidoreductase [Herbihabitans rhizosphaerae]RZS30310.1 putative dehydrogenase [Herbihabitans rhizosphaerae]